MTESCPPHSTIFILNFMLWIGRAGCPRVEAQIRDISVNVLPQGQEGEICIRVETLRKDTSTILRLQLQVCGMGNGSDQVILV